jgi:hypothetical protein
MSGCSTNWKRLTMTGWNKATLLHRRNTVHTRALWRCLRTCSYSGMWRRVVCKSTDVTQEGIASAFRVERYTRFKNHLSRNVAKRLPNTRISEDCKLNIQFNPWPDYNDID